MGGTDPQSEQELSSLYLLIITTMPKRKVLAKAERALVTIAHLHEERSRLLLHAHHAGDLGVSRGIAEVHHHLLLHLQLLQHHLHLRNIKSRGGGWGV